MNLRIDFYKAFSVLQEARPVADGALGLGGVPGARHSDEYVQRPVQGADLLGYAGTCGGGFSGLTRPRGGDSGG